MSATTIVRTMVIRPNDGHGTRAEACHDGHGSRAEARLRNLAVQRSRSGRLRKAQPAGTITCGSAGAMQTACLDYVQTEIYTDGAELNLPSTAASSSAARSCPRLAPCASRLSLRPHAPASLARLHCFWSPRPAPQAPTCWWRLTHRVYCAEAGGAPQQLCACDVT